MAAAPKFFTTPETLAMIAYALNPGHSDLDNEQPMSIRHGDGFLRCTLGDIRKAQRDARQRNADGYGA